MRLSFGESLRRLRMEKGLSQQKLSEMLYVDRSTVVRWETGTRLPDVSMIAKIADCLESDMDMLLRNANPSDEPPTVIMVDDEQIILSGSIPVLEQAMPGAVFQGFTRPSAALEFARNEDVSLAFLDIEIGKTNGLSLCRKLLEINPRVNVVFLTAYMDYAFDAWDTGACGFLVKPLSVQAVRSQLMRLRYPIRGLESV